MICLLIHAHFVCKGLDQIRQRYQVGNERAASKTQGQKCAQTEGYHWFKSITIVYVISKLCVRVFVSAEMEKHRWCVCVCLEERQDGDMFCKFN